MKENEEFIKTPNGFYFVLPKVRNGILPLILKNLLDARKTAKRELEKFKK